MTTDQLKAIRAVCEAITDAVAVAAPQGAPQGILYNALMAHGCSLNQFQSFLRGLVSAGKVRVDGLLVYLTDAEAERRKGAVTL